MKPSMFALFMRTPALGTFARINFVCVCVEREVSVDGQYKYLWNNSGSVSSSMAEIKGRGIIGKRTKGDVLVPSCNFPLGNFPV